MTIRRPCNWDSLIRVLCPPARIIKFAFFASSRNRGKFSCRCHLYAPWILGRRNFRHFGSNLISSVGRMIIAICRGVATFHISLLCESPTLTEYCCIKTRESIGWHSDACMEWCLTHTTCKCMSPTVDQHTPDNANSDHKYQIHTSVDISPIPFIVHQIRNTKTKPQVELSND